MNKRLVSILLALMLTLAMALPAMAGGTNSNITLTATPGTNSVTLSWTPIADTTGFSGYYVYRSTQAGSAGAPAHDFTLTATNFTDPNVEKGKIYYYTVRPVYGTTVGSPSNEVQVRIGNLGVTIIMEIGNSTMLVNGAAQPVDPSSSTVYPVLQNNRTFVPIRAVVEALGGRLSYEAATRMVTVTLDNNTINLWIDSKNIKVNGVNKVMDVAPYISSSRTFLPLRFVLENLNCTTEWNGQTGRITINRVAITANTGQVTGPTGPGGVIPGTPGSINTGSGTGTTDKPVLDTKPPVVSGPSAGGTLEPPATLLNWTGRWDTSFGLLVLNQNGNQVTGNYPDGTLSGTASTSSGNILTGTFAEVNDYTGVYTFTMSADGKTFTGTWHYSDESEIREWTGTRIN